MYYTGGLIYDDSRHYIDHLAPFCALMEWPLFVCEPSVAELAKRYYPGLEVIEVNFWELTLPENLVTCDPFPLLKQAFSPSRLENRTLFWLPHGNSDKNSFFKGMLESQTALVYGQNMIDAMQLAGVEPKVIRIGNFRHFYYKRHSSFYETWTLPLRGYRNILYTPTWDDAENGNSFWQAFPALAKSVADPDRLLIKVHPNTAAKFAAELEMIKGRYESRQNIIFLEEFPPIYPLLELADIYLGDISSIGYDFLTFNRPMYFLNSNKRKLPLFKCGEEISPDQLVRHLDAPQLPFIEQREQLYRSTFDPIETWTIIAKSIKARMK